MQPRACVGSARLLGIVRPPPAPSLQNRGAMAASPSTDPVPRPWWGWLFFYVTTPEGVSREHWFLLGVLGATFLIAGYDMAVLGLALPQIQAGLGVPEAELGGMLAIVRLGVLPAFLLAFLADHAGRRRLLLATIVGFTFFTVLSAFARTATEFAAAQFLARAFMAAEEMVAIVVIAEELGARARGWGLGVIAALGSLGHGLAGLVFAGVELYPYGWRALYVVGVIPLLMLAWIRRGVRETERFSRVHPSGGGDAGVGRTRSALRPMLELARSYPGRMAGLAAVSFPIAFVFFTALQFVSKTLQDTHGWSPGHVSVMYLTIGAVVPAAMVVSGKLGDRLGRKRVLVASTLLNIAGVAVFYGASGWALPFAWAFMMVSFVGIDVLLGALGAELFPTSYRSTASGARALVTTAGGAAGLLVEGALYGAAGSHGQALVWMLPFALLSPLALAVFVPETAGRELEDFAGEAEEAREAPDAVPLRP